MRKMFHNRLFALVIVGLLAILTACGGGSTTGSNGNGAASPSTSAGTTTPAPSTGNSTSTVSFTASGGISGSFKLNTPVAMEASQLLTTPKNKQLTINAPNSNGSLNIHVLPYNGPGAYTLSNKYFADGSQNETIDFQQGQKVWGGYARQSPSWTCSLMVANDTAATVNVEGATLTNYREIKGSFSCSNVLSAPSTDPPLNLSNGQFDVFVRTITGS